MADDSALPSAWITTTNTATKLSVTPTAGSLKSSNPWVIKVIWTPTAGSSNPTWNAVSITVTCEITSFAISGAGTTSFTYNIFSKPLTISGTTLSFTQTPNCGYTYTKGWGYTIPAGNAAAVASEGTILTPSF